MGSIDTWDPLKTVFLWSHSCSTKRLWNFFTTHQLQPLFQKLKVNQTNPMKGISEVCWDDPSTHNSTSIHKTPRLQMPLAYHSHTFWPTRNLRFLAWNFHVWWTEPPRSVCRLFCGSRGGIYYSSPPNYHIVHSFFATDHHSFLSPPLMLPTT